MITKEILDELERILKNGGTDSGRINAYETYMQDLINLARAALALEDFIKGSNIRYQSTVGDYRCDDCGGTGETVDTIRHHADCEYAAFMRSLKG